MNWDVVLSQKVALLQWWGVCMSAGKIRIERGIFIRQEAIATAMHSADSQYNQMI